MMSKKKRIYRDRDVVSEVFRFSSSYMRINVGLKAGNDIWLSTSTTFVDKLNAFKNDPAMATYLRETVYRLLYTTANSAAMTPYIEDIESQNSFCSMVCCLNDEEKKVVVMHLAEDLSFKEIAELESKPLSSISSVYYRALEK